MNFCGARLWCDLKSECSSMAGRGGKTGPSVFSAGRGLTPGRCTVHTPCSTGHCSTGHCRTGHCSAQYCSVKSSRQHNIFISNPSSSLREIFIIQQLSGSCGIEPINIQFAVFGTLYVALFTSQASIGYSFSSSYMKSNPKFGLGSDK